MSVTRLCTKRGYVQKELRLAHRIADEVPEGEPFLFPVLLEDCDVPESLRLLQQEPRGWKALDKRVQEDPGSRRRPPAQGRIARRRSRLAAGQSVFGS